MTCYFAFLGSDALRDSSLKLLDNFERGVSEPQSALMIKTSQMFADEIVDVLLLNIVRSAEAGHSGAGVLEQFAGIIKATINTLIKQVIGKMNNEELRPLSSYIRERLLILTTAGTTKEYVAFPVPADFYTRFRAVLHQGAAGERNPQELLACMEIFTALSHKAFYEDSMKPIKLGFIGRKVVDVGGSAIRKGSQSAIRRLVPGLAGEELKQFSEYFLTMLITV